MNVKKTNTCYFTDINYILFYCPGYISSEGMSEEEINELVQSKIIFVGRSEFQCAECGQLATIKPNIWKHIEAKHSVKLLVLDVARRLDTVPLSLDMRNLSTFNH